MRSRSWASIVIVASLLGCGSAGEDAPQRDALALAVPPAARIELHLVFVHGVTQADSGRLVAHEQLIDLEKAVVAHIDQRKNDRLVVSTTRVNMYTDDSGALTSPRIDDLADGTGQATAAAWRAQLIKKTNAVFPNAKNIVFVGHSTGGRVAAEVGASEEMRDRVAGVVTVHGMIDALQSPKYNLVGPTSYVTACKIIKPDGWCEYSGFVSGVNALDWLARERHVLSLIGASSCSPSFWGGVNDQALPLAAQSSPWSPGITLTPSAGQTFVPAHGTFYGPFCHPDVVGGDPTKHAAAVTAASDAIDKWLFDAAPRVVGAANPDAPYETEPLAAEVFSPRLTLEGPCPSGRHSTGRVDVAGLCRHPGSFDGDDHPFDSSSLIDLTVGTQCDASLRVGHRHANERHAASVWVKRYSLPDGGGLVSTLR